MSKILDSAKEIYIHYDNGDIKHIKKQKVGWAARIQYSGCHEWSEFRPVLKFRQAMSGSQIVESDCSAVYGRVIRVFAGHILVFEDK